MYLNHVGIHMKSSSLKFLSDMQNDDHTKLAYFAQLKNKYIYRYENYLNYDCHRYVSKFRLSDHNLPVERGRYVQPKIPRELRLCTKCKSAMGNEIHALFECQDAHSKHLNAHFFNKILNVCHQLSLLNNSEKLLYLMKACDTSISLIFAKWLEKIHYYYNY